MYKHSIRHSLSPRHHQDGKTPIRTRVSWCGVRVDVQHPAALPPSSWDARRQRCKASHGDAVAVNRLLVECEARVAELFTLAASRQQPPTMEEVRRCVRGEKPATAQGTLLEAIDEEMTSGRISRGLSVGTLRQYEICRQHVAAFEEEEGCISPAAITQRQLERFIVHLTSCGCVNLTAGNYIRLLRRSINTWCRAHDAPPPRLTTPRMRHPHNEIVYLTPEELERLERLNLLGAPLLEESLDAFLFACYSGLRWSDLSTLCWERVEDDAIEVAIVKTGKVVRIELNSHTRWLLAKRERGEGKVFHLPGRNHYADHVRRCCRLAGIDSIVTTVHYVGNERREETMPKWQAISSHTARRTFVVGALARGIPAEVVMRWTGHANYNSMQPYIAIVDERKREEMRKFDAPENAP